MSYIPPNLTSPPRKGLHPPLSSQYVAVKVRPDGLGPPASLRPYHQMDVGRDADESECARVKAQLVPDYDTSACRQNLFNLHP